MASLTVRQLDDALKEQLRRRAARNRRSMEEEVRAILRSAASDLEAPPPNSDRPETPGKTPQIEAASRRILLIIGGGIAAYKSLDLIRRLRERGYFVRVVMTNAAQQFVTPLAAGAISGGKVFTDLFDADSEFDVGHIRLSREADLVVVAPATADLMAKIANGHADDLATAVLLATDKKVLLVPAMNRRMWSNAATRRNLAQLGSDGVAFIGPNQGEMAEHGEKGIGRMAEPLEIVAAVEGLLAKPKALRPLAGKRVIVTSGPTYEPIDPVRFIGNRSSGKQGHAIAAAAATEGAEVVLVTGPVALPDPSGVTVIRIETARDMLAAVEKALPADIAIFAAAVADWRAADMQDQKIKKSGSAAQPLALTENPDILATVAKSADKRPALVIGFAAETEQVIPHAKAKLAKKGCDWIVANDVSPESGVFGGDRNTVHLVTASGVESWPPRSKDQVAKNLIARVVTALEKTR